MLLEEGEHGYLAARASAQVVKAYVEKQRARQNNQNLYRAAAAPGMEHLPVASEAVLTAVESRDKAVPTKERRELLAEIAQPERRPDAAATARLKPALPSDE